MRIEGLRLLGVMIPSTAGARVKSCTPTTYNDWVKWSDARLHGEVRLGDCR